MAQEKGTVFCEASVVVPPETEVVIVSLSRETRGPLRSTASGGKEERVYNRAEPILQTGYFIDEGFQPRRAGPALCHDGQTGGDEIQGKGRAGGGADPGDHVF